MNLPGCRWSCAAVIAAGPLAATAAEASQRRFGLFIGSNAAPNGRERLRHAETDAARMRQVFIDLGQMRAEDATLLPSPDADGIIGAVKAMAERSAGVDGAMLVFYYSGHADDRALLLGSTELPMAELKRQLDAAPAQLGLHLVDACRSGALTRIKGAKLGKPFSLHAEPLAKGRVVITSSAEFEDSQESDRLGGSFFTLHLASGLRGAADADVDGAVTLAEAYRYVFSRTVESTLATAAGPQHPTFRYDMQGRGDVVLTWVRTSALAQLELASDGDYLIVDADSHQVVAEVRGDTERQVALRPGRYRVSKRTRREILSGTFGLEPDESVVVDERLDRRVAHAQLVRKGGTSAPFAAHGLFVAGGIRGNLGRGIETSPTMRLSYALALPWLTLRPQLAIGGSWLGASSFETPRLSYEVDELDGGLAILREEDFDVITVAGGVMVEALWLRQREVRDREPARDAVGVVTGAVLELATAPWNGITVRLSGELAAYTYPSTDVDRAPAGEGELRTALTYRAWVSLGYAL